MAAVLNSGDARVAVLVDCDNVSPEVLEHALKVVAQFGRICGTFALDLLHSVGAGAELTQLPRYQGPGQTPREPLLLLELG